MSPARGEVDMQEDDPPMPLAPSGTQPPASFLSYARGDDEPFVRRLHDDLTARGFKVWFDRVSLPSRQLTFHQEIKDAIFKETDHLIYIAGPKAAGSDYVREEWRFALDCDKSVIPILRLGDYDIVPGELSLLHCEDFRDDAQYATQLDKLVANLLRPEPPLGALLAVPSLPPHFLGRPDLVRRVRDALLVDLQTTKVVMSAEARVGIQGMGGIGKSVLAAALARDRQVRQSYPDGILWVSFGQNLTAGDLVERQRDVARHLGATELFDSVAQGQGVLRQLLAMRAVLLILDDVWQARDTQAFDVLGPRCRVLVTTRDAGILRTLQGELVPVSLFTEPEALQLLADEVGVTPSELPPGADEVVRECGLLPLAVALCGGMAKKRGGDFGSVLERLRRADLDKIADRQSINEQHRDVWRAMQASVEVLAADDQKRFAELAVFSPDRSVPEAAVATLWSHTGDLDDLDTEELLINLAERSLVQLDTAAGKPSEAPKRRISLHDLLRDFADRVAGERSALHQTLLDSYRSRCRDGWHTGPDDGYYFEELTRHLAASGRADEVTTLLLDYRWIVAKLRACDVEALVRDYERQAPDPGSPLELVGGALRLSSHVLEERKDELSGQLVGRLLSAEPDEIRVILRDVHAQTDGPWLCPVWPSLDPPGGSLQRTLLGHQGSVLAVAVSPDGTTLVSASADTTLKVWDLVSSELLATLSGHEAGVCAAAVCPDGKTAVSASKDGGLNVWDLHAATVVRTLQGHQEEASAVTVSPDGRTMVSACRDGNLKVWDLGSGEILRTLEGHRAGVLAAAMCPDGKAVVSGSADGTLRVWDLDSGTARLILEGHRSGILAVAVSGDGMTAVSASGDTTLKVWDLRSGELLRTLEGHRAPVSAVVVSSDGTTAVSGSADTTLKVWNVGSGELLRTLVGQSWVMAVALSSDDETVVSGSWDNTVHVWNLRATPVLNTFEGHRDAVSAVAVSPNGRSLVSASADKTLKVWDLDSAESLRTLEGHEGWVVAASVSPDGRLVVSASADKTVRVWDLDSGELLQTLRGHGDVVSAAVVSPDNETLVSASWDKTLKVWDLESGRLLRTLVGHHAPVASAVISRNGQTIVSASDDGTLRLWYLASGELVRTQERGPGGVTAVAVSSDGGTVVSAVADGTLEVWDHGLTSVLRVLSGHQDMVFDVTVSGDGTRVISASADRTLRLWELASGTPLCVFTADGYVTASLTPDGRRAVAGDALGRLHVLEILPPVET